VKVLAGQEYAAKIINTKKLSARGGCWECCWEVSGVCTAGNFCPLERAGMMPLMYGEAGGV